MDAALKRAQWRLRRAVHAMGWLSLGGVALAVFAAAFALSNIVPLQAEVTALRDRVQQMETQAAMFTAIGQASRPEIRLAAFYGQLPPAEQARDVVRRLHARARDAGLVLERGDYRPSDPEGRLMRYEIVLPVKGSYPQVKRFLAQAMADMPGLALDAIGLQREQDSSRELEVQLRFTAFMRVAA
ncbi:MAG TPA: type 4a pilus biogenesis protein PilO [Burkholderiales bacterium]|nr:type 4a pilus biogenesis protein PilO [Burkholderiales bacterium]